MECVGIPFLPSMLNTAIMEKINSILNKYETVFSITDDIMRPMKEAIEGMEEAITRDILQAGKIHIILHYLSLTQLIPRIAGILTLIWGAKYTPKNPRLAEKAVMECIHNYGTWCTISILYGTGTLMALRTMVETITIPIFKISTDLGFGLIPDMTCDLLMISVYIGLNNDLFF